MYDQNKDILYKRWQERYAQLPKITQNRLDNEPIGRQLKPIKRSRKYPEIGDVFRLVSSDDIEINGIVINNHLNIIHGDDLLVVALLKYGYDYKQALDEGLSSKNLILPPQIIGPEYWTRGYFYNIDHYENDIVIERYGFYSGIKAKFFDEYGSVIQAEPPLLGGSGVATIIGISAILNKELIIAGII